MNGWTRRGFVLSLLIAALTAAPLLAASKAELKARFKERFPALLRGMDAGTIGETFEGYVEFVKGGGGSGDAELRELVEAENADRREYYQIVADEQGEGATPAQVARVTAKFNFRNAKAGHWLKHEDGQWRQKK